MRLVKKKTILLFLLFFGFTPILSAQESENEGELPEFLEMRKPNFFKAKKRAEKYFKKKGTQFRSEELEIDTFATENVIGGREEDNEYHRYKRWEWFWRDRVNADGSFPDPMKAFNVYQQMQNSSANFRTEDTNPTWSSIGMNKNSGGYWGLGQARSIAIFPSNPQIYYVTTVGGGIWKTTNGGTTYTAIGDGLPQLFCGNVLVDPSDANIVYVNLGGTGEWWLANLGVYKSTDGGTTWKATGLTGTRTNGIIVKKMAMSPTDPKVIFAATDKGLYKTINAGTNWTVVHTGDHNDVVFRPGDGTTVYSATTEVYRSVNSGTTWTKSTSLAKNSAVWLGVSESDKEFVSVLFKDSKDLYVSSDRGVTFTSKSTTTPVSDIYYVSPANKNIMYAGAVNLNQSKDGGLTWTEITNWCCGTTAKPEVHADFHGVTHNPSNFNEIYFCNDGGTYRFNESTSSWTNLCNGLVITMYYRISSAQINSNMVLGASQDNGGNLRKADATWRNTVGGDATMALIDPSNDAIQYSSYINGDGITRTNNTWSTTKDLTPILRTAGAVGGDWATQFAIDQSTPANIVAAYQDVLRSTNRGDAWTKISTNLTGGKDLQHIAIAPNDGKTIYTSFDGTLYRTFDTGTNWSSVNSPAGNITRIVVSPTNAKTVYLTTNGGNGKRIYKSTNGGDSWTNITLNFPNDISALCIAYEKGTDEGLYVGTPVGVFYKNASMTQWIYFGTGLPNTEVNDISISYGAKKIRVGTWGRGLWETDLYSVPVTFISEQNLSEEKFNLFPNPFNESIQVKTSNGIASVRLFDLSGRELESPSFDTNGIIKLSHLPKGVYTIEIKNLEGNKWAKKIIKE